MALNLQNANTNPHSHLFPIFPYPVFHKRLQLKGYIPFLSDILYSICLNSKLSFSFHLFSSHSGYFLPHNWYDFPVFTLGYLVKMLAAPLYILSITNGLVIHVSF